MSFGAADKIRSLVILPDLIPGSMYTPESRLACTHPRFGLSLCFLFGLQIISCEIRVL